MKRDKKELLEIVLILRKMKRIKNLKMIMKCKRKIFQMIISKKVIMFLIQKNAVALQELEKCQNMLKPVYIQIQTKYQKSKNRNKRKKVEEI